MSLTSMMFIVASLATSQAALATDVWVSAGRDGPARVAIDATRGSDSDRSNISRALLYVPQTGPRRYSVRFARFDCDSETRRWVATTTYSAMRDPVTASENGLPVSRRSDPAVERQLLIVCSRDAELRSSVPLSGGTLASFVDGR